MVKIGLVRLGLVRLYKLFIFYYPKGRHFTQDFFSGLPYYGLYLIIITSTACNLHRRVEYTMYSMYDFIFISISSEQ